jgi:hypothetical protein
MAPCARQHHPAILELGFQPVEGVVEIVEKGRVLCVRLPTTQGICFLGRIGAFSLHSDSTTPDVFAPKLASYWGKGKAAGPRKTGGFAAPRSRALSTRERYHRCMSGRGFPSPWTVDEDHDACFIVRDANGQALGYFHFEEDPGRRSAGKLLTKDEARRVATNFARLPELLRWQPHWR